MPNPAYCFPAGNVTFAAFFPSVTCSSASSTVTPHLNRAHSASSLKPLRTLTSVWPEQSRESASETRQTHA